jgi:hypothetical protein
MVSMTNRPNDVGTLRRIAMVWLARDEVAGRRQEFRRLRRHRQSIAGRLRLDPEEPGELLHNLLHDPGRQRLARRIINNFFDLT